MGKRNYGLLDEVFHFVDPILDEIDPMHNKVQEWTTGSKYRDEQSPYFQTIFPMVMDGFFPGVGSLIGAVDGASTGNWTKAGLSALASVGGFGGFSGGTEAQTAQEASAANTAQPGLSSTGGETAGTVYSGSSSAGDVAASNDAYVGAVDAGNAGSGLRAPDSWLSTSHTGDGLLSVDPSAPSSTGTMGGANGISANQTTGVQGSTPTQYGQWQGQYGATVDPTYAGISGGHQLSAYSGSPKEVAGQSSNFNTGKAAQVGMKAFAKKAEIDQREAMKAAMNKPQPVMDQGGNERRQVASFQQISPYASFGGGYNPRRYGRGLMG